MSREIEKEILKMGLKIARYGVSKHIAELFDLDMKRTIITLINKAESIELVKKDSHTSYIRLMMIVISIQIVA